MDAQPARGRHVAEAPVDDVPVVRAGRHAPVKPDSGRRRAESLDDPANTGPIMVPTGKARLIARFSAATAAAAMVGTAGYAASLPGSGPVGLDKPLEPVQTSQQPIVAPGGRLKEPKVVVKALPKPRARARPVVVPPPVPVAPPVVVAPAPRFIPAPAPQPVAPPVRIVPAPQPVPVVPPKPVVPTLPKPVPPPAPSGKAAQIAAAARAQLGRFQDCTMLVTNALATVGINFHGWPAGYFSLGRTVAPAEAVPGDLVYYQNGGMGLAHIAVYEGGGQAVHGGWNGNNTVLTSVNVGSGPVYIRVY